MSHAATAIPPRTLRRFGLLMAAMIAGIFGLLFPLLKNRSLPPMPWALALLFAIFALVSPPSLALTYRLWMKLGHVLGWINSRIILTLLFWVVVTPLSLLFRLLRRDILKLDFRDPKAASYRVPVRGTDPKQGMERPF